MFINLFVINLLYNYLCAYERNLITTNYKIKIMENNLKEFREKKGVTKYRMAKDLKVSYPTIENWEKTDNLSPTKMKICADYLGMEVTEIFKI